MPGLRSYLKSRFKGENPVVTAPPLPAAEDTIAAYQMALDKAAVVAITDHKGIILHVNDNFCEVTGYDRSELLGQDHRLINSGHHPKTFIRQLWDTILSGQVWRGEILNRKKSGQLFWTDTTIVPVQDGEKGKFRFIAIQTDISSRKHAEEELAKSLLETSNYKHAIDQSSILAITDHKGIITYANDNFCLISRYSREELIGSDHRIINSGYHPKDFFARMWRTIAQGRIWKGEIRNKAKDGSYYWVDTTIVPFRGADGKPLQYVAIRTDITARKISEENEKNLARKVKMKDREFSDLLARINDGFLVLDKNFRYTYANEMIGRLTGLDPLSLIGQNIWDVFPDAIGSATYKAFLKAYDEQTFQYNTDYNPLLGLWQENYIYPSEEGLSVFVRDISTQKKSQLEIRKNERIYQTIASNIPGSLICIIDKDHRFQLMEGDLMEKLGYEKDEFLQYKMEDALKPDRARFLIPLVERAMQGEYHVAETTLKDHFLHYRFVPLRNDSNEVESVLVAILDMTEQRISQARILEQYQEIIHNEKRFRALIENISDGILLLGSCGQVQYQSPSASKITGYSPEEVSQLKIFDFLPDKYRGEGIQIFDQLLASPGETIHSTFKMRHKNGHDMWIEGSLTNLLHDESVRAVIMNYRDITERRNAEKQKQRSEAKLRTIFNNTKVAYVLMDNKFRIISFNPLAKERYAREIHLDLVENGDMLQYLEKQREPQVLENFRQVLAGNKINYEVSFVESDDSKCWYHVDMFPVSDEKGYVLGMIISSEDITERKIAELERDRMTADIIHHNKNLEQFAYIVSHNLRSPVANIIGLANLISQHETLSKVDFEKCLKGLTGSASKLDEVINDLNFILQSRREIDERKENVKFSDLLSNIRTSISEQLSKQDVTIESDFRVDSFFTVKGYLHSIFINLITNSIKYRNPDIRCVIKISSFRENGRLVLTFSDNGLGIDLQKYGEKIFGLYKKFHNHVEGKGMGLYMVRSQIEILGGSISVNSELSRGTSFRVEFPAGT